MNNSMFLPQVAEDDQYDAQGRQIDDINSLAEYINQVILGNHDDTPEDEDDDDGQNFHLVKTTEYRYYQLFTETQQDKFVVEVPQTFIEFVQSPVENIYFDIITPPPDKA